MIQISPLNPQAIPNRIDERLIRLGFLTCRHSPRLPVRLFGEPRGSDVRNPDLNRTKTLRPQSSTVSLHRARVVVLAMRPTFPCYM